MPKVTLELRDEIDIESKGARVTANLAGLPDLEIANCIVSGLEQKVGDAAAGVAGQTFGRDGWKRLSKEEKDQWLEQNRDLVRNETATAMGRVAEGLEQGNWTLR